MLREAELRPDLLHVLRDHLNGPGHDREHAAPPGRASLHRLAVADRKDAEAAELGELRIYPEVADVEHGGLFAAQAPGVDHLEKRGVPIRRLPSLPAETPDFLHLAVRENPRSSGVLHG